MNNYENTDIKTLMKNLLSALEHIHELGIMHRNIKPDIILFDSAKNDYDITIADFGLSIFVNEPDIMYKRCRTSGFIATEIIEFKESSRMYNEKCGIFSAEVIFYILENIMKILLFFFMKELLRFRENLNSNQQIVKTYFMERLIKEIDFKKLIENGHEKVGEVYTRIITIGYIFIFL